MDIKKYTYPFRENAKGIRAANIYVDKGDLLEKYIFDKYVLPIVNRLDVKDSIVDIGAGEGRYSVYFGSGAKRIIAIEPDQSRFEKTKDNLKSLNSEVFGVHGTVKDAYIEEGTIDLAVCIHILQHINPDNSLEILDFVEKGVRKGGLFVLAFTKKTTLDYSWNLAWNDKGTSMYSPVPEEVFKLTNINNVSRVLPVRKLDLSDTINELKSRGFSVEEKQEYAPRFVNQRSTIKGRTFMWLYRILPSAYFHKLINAVGYPKQEDVVIVARKIR